MKNESLKKKLMEQIAGLSLVHFEILKDSFQEVLVMREPEIAARDALVAGAKSKGINLRDEVVGGIELVIHPPKKRKPSSTPATKGGRFYLVANGDVTLISRRNKALTMKRSGVNVLCYDELPADLKAKADLLG